MDDPITVDRARARLDAEFGPSPDEHWTVTAGHGYVLEVTLAPCAAAPPGAVLVRLRVIAGTSEECRQEFLRYQRDLDRLVDFVWTTGWELAVVKGQVDQSASVTHGRAHGW